LINTYNLCYDNYGEKYIKQKFIICLTGMPGAGKSTVADAIKDEGFILINMGDCIRMEAIKKKLELNDKNLGNLMLDLRRQHGLGAIAQLVINQINEKYSDCSFNKFIIDGIRSIHEIQQLQTIGIVKILAIHGSVLTRFRHLKNRSREDAPSSLEDCLIRDKRELSVGVSEAIAFADEMISNNEITIDQLKRKAKGIAKKWISSISS
jgi:dephospho-CoA kinase